MEIVASELFKDMQMQTGVVTLTHDAPPLATSSRSMEEQLHGNLDVNLLLLFQQLKRNTWHQQMQLDKQHGYDSS